MHAEARLENSGERDRLRWRVQNNRRKTPELNEAQCFAGVNRRNACLMNQITCCYQPPQDRDISFLTANSWSLY